MRHLLSNQISYRNYDEFCVLIHHSKKLFLKLNHSAGIILDKIKNRRTDYDSDELEFIDTLKTHNIVNDNHGYTSGSLKSTNSKQTGQNNRILDELKNYAQKNIIPVNCQIELTHRCNLNCQHCYLSSETPDKSEELNTEQLKNLISRLAEMGGLFLTFTGGEPFLRGDFEELFYHARENMFAVSILTSGTKCDEEQLKRFANSGIDSVQVSIHGYNDKTHDNFTGITGSFSKAMNTLKILRKLHISTRAAVSINKLNFSFADKIFHALQENGFDYNINLNMLPKISSHQSTNSLQLNANEISYIAKNYQKRHHFRMKDLNKDDFICSAARSSLAIDPYGNILPCILLRQSGGNIGSKPLEDIWKYSNILNDIRQLRISDLVDCADCSKRSSCNRCSGLAFLEGIEIISHSNLDCIQAGVYNGFEVF